MRNSDRIFCPQSLSPMERGSCEKFQIADKSRGYLLGSTPTNIRPSVVLECEDYGLKVSINAKVTGRRVYWRSGKPPFWAACFNRRVILRCPTAYDSSTPQIVFLPVAQAYNASRRVDKSNAFITKR